MVACRVPLLLLLLLRVTSAVLEAEFAVNIVWGVCVVVSDSTLDPPISAKVLSLQDVVNNRCDSSRGWCNICNEGNA